MATYELHEATDDRRSLPDRLAGLGHLIGLVARHRRRHRTLQSLARLDAIQLQDIELDPDAVFDALNGDGEMLWQQIPRLR